MLSVPQTSRPRPSCRDRCSPATASSQVSATTSSIVYSGGVAWEERRSLLSRIMCSTRPTPPAQDPVRKSQASWISLSIQPILSCSAPKMTSLYTACLPSSPMPPTMASNACDGRTNSPVLSARTRRTATI